MQLSQLWSYKHTFKELIKTDLLVLRPQILGKIIDLFIWIITIVLVNAYIMPFFGVSAEYGVFMLASSAASAGLFEIWPSVTVFISDLEGEKSINYYLTLPIPSWMVLVRSILNCAMNAAIMGLLVIPIGKLFVWSLLDMSTISWFKYFIIFVLSCVFYGSFSLWTMSFVKNMLSVGSVWMRFIYPLWFLGCFQFSWQSLYQMSPVLAYLNLLNPMTYVSEGFRASILGQQNSLNFWLCASMLIVFTVAMGAQAILRLKKRLDFV